MTTPTVGRVVIVVGALVTSNAADVAPALITRVWSSQDGAPCVNVTAFPDAGIPKPLTSVYLYDTDDEARKAAGSYVAAYWPPRV